MSDSIWVGIAEIPWWIDALFIYFLYLSFMATKPRIVSLQKLFIFPSIATALFLICIVMTIPITLKNIFLCLAMLVLGSLLGWLQFRVMKIKAIRNEFNFYIPGTWSLLIFVLTIFAVKYYSGYQLNINPDTLRQPKYASALLILFGLCAGLFFGRLAYSLYCLKGGPFVERVNN